MKINQDSIQEQWYIIDATGKRIGQISTKVAELLLGKNNPKVKSHVLPQNKVIVINAEKVDFTPKRGYTKFYDRFSGYPSGRKFETLENLIKRRPTELLLVCFQKTPEVEKLR
jgi:large subunit ribosomal protein L13